MSIARVGSAGIDYVTESGHSTQCFYPSAACTCGRELYMDGARPPQNVPEDMIYIRSEDDKGSRHFTAWLNGKVVGDMKITVEPLVHDMTIEEGTLQRKIADALFQYASGYVRASGFSEALVLVSDINQRMQRYVEARAVPEEPSKIYIMEVK